MRIRTALVAAALAAAGSVAGLPTRSALAAPPAWEQDLAREVEEQNDAIEQATRTKSTAALVQRYASRASRSPTALNRFLLGRALFHNQDYSGARAQMKAALDDDPAFWPAHVRLAVLDQLDKDWTGAAAHVEAALARAPHDPEALWAAARIASQREDWAAAVRHLSVRVADDPTDVRARRFLAGVHFERKDYAAAIREIEMVRSRAREEPQDLRLLVQSLAKLNREDEALALLDAALAKDPKDLSALDLLASIHLKRRDLAKYRADLERILPLAPPETQPQVAKEIAAVRAALEGKLPEGAPAATQEPPTMAALAAGAQSKDVEVRREALKFVYESAQMGYVKVVPREILVRMQESVEPDPECRKWVIKIAGLAPSMVSLLGTVGMYDTVPSARFLAEEALGDSEQPIVLAYLRGILEDPQISIDEYNVVRASVSRVTGFRDLPSGVTRVSTPEELAVSREAWRRWHLSDESTPAKLAAVRQIKALDVSQPERLYLQFVVNEPTFEVMREGYLAMRDAVARKPEAPFEAQVLPQFPKRTDCDVTRAAMREIQQAVAQWWRVWLTERARTLHR